MQLKDLGFNEFLENHRKENNLDSFNVGRIISEHKERYIVKSEDGEYEAELVGNLRFSAVERSDFPAVGDWVAISEYDDDKALIYAIYPRESIIERQSVGKFGQKQIIATNVDFGLIVQAIDRDFNVNRLQRYLTICYESKIEPIIIINKIDLISDSEVQDVIKEISQRIKNVPVIPLSNQTKEGIVELNSILEIGKTYCLLGSSGVGKSTLINTLSGENLMKTDSISISTNRGKHITSHRELFILDNGAIFIDNPGMREVGIADSRNGLDATFDEISDLGKECKFKDCTHVHEIGCAILKAIDDDELDIDSYNNYVKLAKEKDFFESSREELKQRDKNLGKLIKNFKKIKNNKKL